MDEFFLEILPNDLKRKILSFKKEHIQEIRVRINKPVIIIKEGAEHILDKVISTDDIKFIVQRISNYSLYAYEEDIKKGFITIKGGHRIGIAGECVMDKDGVKTIKNISSLNIRVTREFIGSSIPLLNYIVDNDKVKNTLIISPPKCGKTTILRDLSRLISNGNSKFKLNGKKVVVVDERSEICGSYLGVPQMDVGIRTDVLDNCQKTDGMIMAIRSLSPEVLICDEIGSFDDVEALKVAFNSGVNVIVSIHGESFDDISKRSNMRNLIEEKIIEIIVVLGNLGKVGNVMNIYSLDKSEGVYKCLR
ncbi:stage III sporulation protein AA [Clostridium chrysemydis]|uniref:stage III sporulation protein AA n=1 Tax=Clostridium chrysemydis TaxID=2665504 RepID=UPI0018833623|nr:stage III sporulation protein AA [Clostridium chrysemydis]